MNLRIIITTIIIVITSIMLISCANDSKETDVDIEQAVVDGRNAAKMLIHAEIEDSMQLQNYILEAKASQSKYIIDNQPKSAEAFDSAFFSLLRTVKPELARQLRK